MTVRDEFEAWAVDNCQSVFWGKKPDGRYGHIDAESAWQVWQASRKAIVLPENAENHIAGEYGNGYADALHVCRLAIGQE